MFRQFISQLLDFRFEDRLGYKDAIEVVLHPFFKGIVLFCDVFLFCLYCIVLYSCYVMSYHATADIDWDDIDYGTTNTATDSFDSSSIFDEGAIPDHQSSIFDRF